jgi:hypothetical protein
MMKYALHDGPSMLQSQRSLSSKTATSSGVYRLQLKRQQFHPARTTEPARKLHPFPFSLTL